MLKYDLVGALAHPLDSLLQSRAPVPRFWLSWLSTESPGIVIHLEQREILPLLGGQSHRNLKYTKHGVIFCHL